MAQSGCGQRPYYIDATIWGHHCTMVCSRMEETAWIHLMGALLKDLKIHIDLWLSSRVCDIHVLISPGRYP